MEVHDYNGAGKWSSEEILHRYSQYCRELNVQTTIDLSPVTFVEGDVKWIYPVMNKVIVGIEQGDPACRRIGIEFVEENGKFPFGKILKSNTARALRRAELTIAEQARIRQRLVTMLIEGNVPHEYKQYAKLLKKIGLDGCWDGIESRIDRSNKYVMKYYNYLKEANIPLHKDSNCFLGGEYRS